MMKRLSKFILSTLSLCLLTSCFGSPQEDTPHEYTLSLDHIVVRDYTTDFNVNDTFIFDGVCIAYFKNGSPQEVTPKSVSTPYMGSAGEKEVWVRYEYNRVEVGTMYTITVHYVDVEEISLQKEYYTLTVGETIDLGLNMRPTNPTNPAIEWEVEDSSLLSIDEDNKLTGLKPGITSIKVTGDKGKSYEALVKVNNEKKDKPLDIPEGYLTGDVSINVASIAYSSISIDFMALGYEVYPATRGSEIGLAYVSYDDIYESTINSDIYYLNAGFVSFKVNKENVETNPTYQKIYPTDEEMLKSKIWFVDSLRVIDLPVDHFMADDKYVKYSLNGDTLNIELFDKVQDNYDTSLGSIYDYDINDYDFIPLAELPVSKFSYESLVKEIKPEQVLQAYDEMIERQNQEGFVEEVSMTMFISMNAFSMLNGTLNQKEELNGTLIDTIKDIEFNPKTQYLSMMDDGSVGVKDINTNGKSFKDWFIDAVVLAGGTAIAITLTICTSGAGTVISGAIFGALGEYFSQAVIENRSIKEINFEKVIIASLVGVLTTGIPVANSFSSFVANTIVTAVVEAAGSVAMNLVEGQTDASTIVKEAASAALFASLFYALRNINFVKNGKVTSVDYPTEEIKTEKIFSHSITEVDECPTLSFAKESWYGNSVNNVVGGSYYNASSSTASNAIRDSVNSSSSKGVKDVLEEFLESIFSM